jgi:hypothetical protein
LKYAQVLDAITELDNLVNVKRKMGLLDKAGNRPHDRKRGAPRIVNVLPKPSKDGPKIPRLGIDRQWLEDNPEADVPSRILEWDEGANEGVAVAEPDVQGAEDAGRADRVVSEEEEDFRFEEQHDLQGLDDEQQDWNAQEGDENNMAEDDFDEMYY